MEMELFLMCSVGSIILIHMGMKAKARKNHTIQFGERMAIWVLVGYDWAPHGVDLATHDHEKTQRFVPDPGKYVWQEGASVISESLITGTEPLINVEHALHVLEIIEATRESGASGKRIKLESTFKWPMI